MPIFGSKKCTKFQNGWKDKIFKVKGKEIEDERKNEY